jgi:hypothetical protein
MTQQPLNEANARTMIEAAETTLSKLRERRQGVAGRIAQIAVR